MKGLDELAAIHNKMKQTVHTRTSPHSAKKVIVGMATCGIAAGARDVLNEFVNQIAQKDLEEIMVTQTGCIGLCQLEPVVEIVIPNCEKVTYVRMDAQKVARVVEEHLEKGMPVQEYTIEAAGN